MVNQIRLNELRAKYGTMDGSTYYYEDSVEYYEDYYKSLLRPFWRIRRFAYFSRVTFDVIFLGYSMERVPCACGGWCLRSGFCDVHSYCWRWVFSFSDWRGSMLAKWKKYFEYRITSR